MVERPTLDFGSGRDPRIRAFKPHVTLCTGVTEPAWGSLCLSLPLSLKISELEINQSINQSGSIWLDKLWEMGPQSTHHTDFSEPLQTLAPRAPTSPAPLSVSHKTTISPRSTQSVPWTDHVITTAFPNSWRTRTKGVFFLPQNRPLPGT